MKEKIVLIGAGSAEFTRGLVADIIRTGVATDLALVDIDPAALETAERLVAKMIAAKQAPVALSAATDRRELLRGATAVICTVGVGGRHLRHHGAAEAQHGACGAQGARRTVKVWLRHGPQP